MKNIKQHIAFDIVKILPLVELYLKMNADKCQDNQSYAFRSSFKDIYPKAITTVTSMPLNDINIKKVIDWRNEMTRQHVK